MSLKLIEIIIPKGRTRDIPELLHEFDIEQMWVSTHLSSSGPDSQEGATARVSLLVSSGMVEPILDALDGYLKGLPGARAFLVPVEAEIPKREKAGRGHEKAEEEPGREEEDLEEEEGESEERARISRQELLATVSEGSSVTVNYLLMVLLSAIIAALGLIRNDMAIIIGAMVLAPLLLPNMALGLASTLGDTELMLRAVRSVGSGIGLAIAVGVVIGVFVRPSPEIPSILSRTSASVSDVVLALASGGAGALALVSGGHLSLIGVMVAVALMPPLVTSGLMLGAGLAAKGLAAMELALINIICINLAAVATFRLHGIRPASWWESERADRATRVALIIWGVLLAVLVLLLVTS